MSKEKDLPILNGVIKYYYEINMKMHVVSQHPLVGTCIGYHINNNILDIVIKDNEHLYIPLENIESYYIRLEYEDIKQ